MAELICIVCPKGCHLSVDETAYTVTGHGCKRGIAYGQKELQNPTRVVTSTVRAVGGSHPRLPVKTRSDVPKAKMMDVVRALDGIVVNCPVKVGDVILPNVCGTGVDVIATRDL